MLRNPPPPSHQHPNTHRPRLIHRPTPSSLDPQVQVPMAFQTNVFRDGEWVTETVNLHAVLKSQKAAPKGAAKQDPLKPPPCGLLTTTLVESARANSILPARIRSSNTQDVAFVGVSATAVPLALPFLPCPARLALG